jgi:lysophospholipase L1-like esterase
MNAIACLAGLVMMFAMQPTPSFSTPNAEAPRVRLSTTPAFHEGTEKRHERFNAIAKKGEAQLVFLGDSITEGWENEGKDVWAKRYATRHAANFGIGGDRTEHVLWRIDHGNFDGLKPKLIVVMIGTNNAGHRQEAAKDTAAGVSAIVDRLRAKCPDAKILLLGIFPRGEKVDDPMRRLTASTNERIKKLADDDRVVYKDIGSVFVQPTGTISKEIMPDFLHLSAKGYELWAEAIEGEVKKGLGEK